MAKQYKIVGGDTLDALAVSNKTDRATLLKLNPQITDKDKIFAGQLLNLPDAPVAGADVPPAPLTTAGSAVSTSDEIRNADADAKAAQLKKDTDAKAEADRLVVQAQIKASKDAIEGAVTTEKPTQPKLEEGFKTLQSEKDAGGNSVLDYQTSLTENRTKRSDIMSAFEDFTVSAAEGQGMSAFLSQKGEKGRLAQKELDRLDREAAIIQMQISNRNETISTIMGLRKEDYATASANYEKEFAQATNIYNAITGRADKEATAEEKAVDNARANLQVIQSQISKGAISYDKLPPETQLQIDVLEKQAGFPKGYTQFITKEITQGDSSVTVTSLGSRTGDDGAEYYDLMVRDKQGNVKVQSIVKTPAPVDEAKSPEALISKIKEYNEQIYKGKMEYDEAKAKLQEEFPQASDKAIGYYLGVKSD